MGLLGVTLPDDYGCAGANYVSYGLVAREIERIDSGYRSMMSVQSSLVMYPIYAYGDETQRRTYLPKLASGEWVGCFRPHRAGRRLRPRRHEDPGREGRGRLSPHRLEDVDLQFPHRRCLRRLGEVGRPRDQIRGFVLEKGMKGLSAPKIGGKLSLRASITGDRHGRGCRPRECAPAQRLGPEGPVRLPQPGPLRHLLGESSARPRLLAPGAAVHARPQQFGRPLAATQLVQKKLADMQTEITLGLQASLRVGVSSTRARSRPR